MKIDLIPIDKWFQIALCVQKFNINNNSENERIKNFIILDKFLKQKDYIINKDIELSLLENIYNLNCDINYKKAYFMEQISALKDIGVNNIAFIPNNYLKNIINLTDKNNKTTILKSAFTNGVFNIRKWEDNGFKYYSIINLENANYVIIKTMYVDENRLANVDAYLYDFNGNYPDKKEIRKFKQAKLLKYKKDLYIQKYEMLDRNSISCKNDMKLKLGKKQKNNQYYYE